MPKSEESTKPIWLRILLFIPAVLAGLVIFFLITWGTLSQYYSNLPWTNVRLLLAALFCLFGVWAFWIAGRGSEFNIRHLLNGWMGRYFYSVGLIDNSLPFAELREKSHINEAALAAQDDPEFSRAIRKSLPNMH